MAGGILGQQMEIGRIRHADSISANAIFGYSGTMSIFRRPERIHGQAIPAPRLTRHALKRFLLWIMAPFLLLCLLGDVALYFLFREVFGSCYGLLCLFS